MLEQRIEEEVAILDDLFLLGIGILLRHRRAGSIEIALPPAARENERGESKDGKRLFKRSDHGLPRKFMKFLANLVVLVHPESGEVRLSAFDRFAGHLYPRSRHARPCAEHLVSVHMPLTKHPCCTLSDIRDKPEYDGECINSARATTRPAGAPDRARFRQSSCARRPRPPPSPPHRLPP